MIATFLHAVFGFVQTEIRGMEGTEVQAQLAYMSGVRPEIDLSIIVTTSTGIGMACEYS